MNEKEIKEQLEKHFDAQFTRWAQVHMPTPAVAYDALRAFAYEWYMEGIQRGQGAVANAAREHWQTLETIRVRGFVD